MRKGC